MCACKVKCRTKNEKKKKQQGNCKTGPFLPVSLCPSPFLILLSFCFLLSCDLQSYHCVSDISSVLEAFCLSLL